MRKEFLDEVGDTPIKMAKLCYREDYDADFITFLLNEGYDKTQFDNFLRLIDFEYDNGYGVMHLNGCIWYKDGTWSERREYDGSEWWEFI